MMLLPGRMAQMVEQSVTRDSAEVAVAPSSLQSKYSAFQPIVVLGFVAEGAIVFAALSGRLNTLAALAVHLALVLLLCLLLQRRLRSGADGGLALLAIVGILATGPVGAFCALLMPILTRRNTTSEALLPHWYKRIALSAEQDAFTRLSDRVAIGRAANLAAPLPQPFVDLFQSGPIAEQQTALGLIARGFHPGYLPVLKAALASPEPVIRVQAAAVAARIRAPLNAHAAALFARAANPMLSTNEAVDIAAELLAATDSGLLEAAEHSMALKVRDGVMGRTFARLDARRRTAATGIRVSPQRTSDDVDDAYASHLLAEGRFEEFRLYRLAARRPVIGRYRARIVIARPLAADIKRHIVPLAVRR